MPKVVFNNKNCNYSIVVQKLTSHAHKLSLITGTIIIPLSFQNLTIHAHKLYLIIRTITIT